MGHENILKQNDAMSAQFYRFPEDHWIADLKWMDFAVCNLYFKTTVNKHRNSILSIYSSEYPYNNLMKY